MTKRYLKLISLCIISFALTACTNSAAGQSSRENDLVLQGKTQSKILKNVEHHYYYSQLGPYQKENYLLLRKDSEIFKDTIHLAPDSEKNLMKTIDAFIMDNPDLYWLTSTSYQVAYSDSDVYVSFKVPKDAKTTYEQLQTIGDQILSASPKGDDYQKVEHFYNYIINHTDYNKEALEDLEKGNNSLIQANQDIKSVFLDHLSVCNGYAQTFQFLCQKASLDSIYVRGNVATLGTNNDCNHCMESCQN